jgi:hypothetical protein
MNHSPHVVILGAGASLACFPKGDVTGRRLPLMNNLVDTVGLRELIERAGLSADIDNFEAFYDEIASGGRHKGLVEAIESRVREYFAAMRLPAEATLYDYLILALRKKDLIATFNWDPFLAQAFRRNRQVEELPRMAFLHGNVAIGTCAEHKVVNFADQVCSKCRTALAPSKLLYPVRQKDYNNDPFIKGEWQALRAYLEKAYYVTIFGYSAPATDLEAKNLMLEVWKKNPTLQLAEVDIVDVKPREVLEKNWSDFLYKTHYGICDDVQRTILFRHPRRSCDAFAMATLQQRPWRENPIPITADLAQLQAWVAPLVSEEKAEKFSGEPCGTNAG